MDLIQILSIIISISVFFAIILLIRSNKLKERFAIIWLITAIIICVFSVNRKLLEEVAYALNVHYPPSFVFLLGIIFLIIINISFSVYFSDHSKKIIKLAQKITLLEHKLNRLKIRKGKKKSINSKNIIKN